MNSAIQAFKPFKLQYDWRNYSDRKRFEHRLNEVREERANWSLWKKIKWFFTLFVPQFIIVVTLYGTFCWVIVEYGSFHSKIII